MIKTVIHHWTEHPFQQCWSCWVYPSNNKEFLEWMENNMTGEYNCISRFNNGDPMLTVDIRSSEDALKFKLKWM